MMLAIRRRARLGVAVAAAAVALSGCDYLPKPDPVQFEEWAQKTDENRQALFDNQDPVAGPISLYEAMARAIKYNLDYRITLMEQAFETAQLDLLRYDMLPKLAAQAGYRWRDNVNAASSRSIISNRESLEPSTSEETSLTTGDLSLTWSLIDFGLSYVEQQQQADRALSSQERRRRILQNLIQEVRGSFWRAASADRLSQLIDPILDDAGLALDDARAVEEQRLQPVIQTLRYQKSLLEIIRQLQTVRSAQAQAKAELAALMNLQPGMDYQLDYAQPAERQIPDIKMEIPEMERVALVRRPELREQAYQLRLVQREAHKAILRMLPSPSLLLGRFYNSNSFLVNNGWTEAGGRVVWNLIDVLKTPKRLELAETQGQVVEARRLAQSVAVISQVHIAYHDYQQALDTYDHVRKLAEIERRIFENVRDQAESQAQSPLERIRSAASAVAAELNYDRAYAELQNSASRMYVTLGLDPVPGDVETADLGVLTRQVQTAVAAWETGEYPLANSWELPSTPVAAQPGSPPVAAQPEAAPTQSAEPMPVRSTPAAPAAVAPTAAVPAPLQPAVPAAQSAAPVRSGEAPATREPLTPVSRLQQPAAVAPAVPVTLRLKPIVTDQPVFRTVALGKAASDR